MMKICDWEIIKIKYTIYVKKKNHKIFFAKKVYVDKHVVFVNTCSWE